MNRAFLVIIGIILLGQGLCWAGQVDANSPVPYARVFDDYYGGTQEPEQPAKPAKPAKSAPQFEVINGYTSGLPYVTTADMAYQNFSAKIKPLMKEGVTKGEITDILGQPFLTGNKGKAEVWVYPNQTFIRIINKQIAEGKYHKYLENEDMTNYKYQTPDYFDWNNNPYFLVFIFKDSGSAGGYIDKDTYTKMKAQTGTKKLPSF